MLIWCLHFLDIASLKRDHFHRKVCIGDHQLARKQPVLAHVQRIMQRHIQMITVGVAADIFEGAEGFATAELFVEGHLVVGLRR